MKSVSVEVVRRVVKIISKDSIIKEISDNMKSFLSSKKTDFVLEIKSSVKGVVSVVKKNGKELDVKVPETLKTKGKTIFIEHPFFEQRISKNKSVAIVKSNSYVLLRNAIRNTFMIWFKELFPFHGSGIIRNNKGYLFCGPPGYGKSTIAKNSSGALNDEFIFVNKEGDDFYMYGTPFGGEIEPKNKKVKLDRIFFIKQYKKNSLRKISDKEKFINLLESDHLFFKVIFKDEPEIAKTIFNRAKLLEHIPSYELRFTIKCDFWSLIK